MRQLLLPYRSMRFYLGSHRPQWLARTTVPLFVSDVTLRLRRTLPRAVGRWALDSGAFSQLQAHGGWPADSARAYGERIRRYAEEIGGLDWAAPQDWMCEAFMLERTGLTVAQHQERTVGNYLDLAALELPVPVIPVIQGYLPDEYVACADRFAAAGVELDRLPLIGVGSVCRRQGMRAAVEVMTAIRDRLPSPALHCFGVKVTGLRLLTPYIDSADSMAWSYHARHRPPLPGHTAHRNCANCLDFAELWYQRLPVALPGAQTGGLRWCGESPKLSNAI